MSEKFTRKNFFQRIIGGAAALTLTKTEAKPVLNQIPTTVESPLEIPEKKFKDYGSYSGMYSCTGYYYSGIYHRPTEETWERFRTGKC